LRLPSRKHANRTRRRARVEEHLAILRVVQARFRRRGAEATIRGIEVIEETRRLLRSEGAARVRWLSGLVTKARRRWWQPPTE
jgi:hypothetical protein